MGVYPVESGDTNQRRWNEPYGTREDEAPFEAGLADGPVDPEAEEIPGEPVAEQPVRGRGGSKDSYTIGEVVERLRPEFPTLSVSKIRYLERRRLINLSRTRGGYRLFSGQDIELLKYILTLQDKEYLVGGKYSYVDAAFVPWFEVAAIFWSNEMDLEKKFPHVNSWLNRIKARPAVAKTIDDKAKAAATEGK